VRRDGAGGCGTRRQLKIDVRVAVFLIFQEL
jgi:hypothetical protein